MRRKEVRQEKYIGLELIGPVFQMRIKEHGCARNTASSCKQDSGDLNKSDMAKVPSSTTTATKIACEMSSHPVEMCLSAEAFAQKSGNRCPCLRSRLETTLRGGIV